MRRENWFLAPKILQDFGSKPFLFQEDTVDLIWSLGAWKHIYEKTEANIYCFFRIFFWIVILFLPVCTLAKLKKNTKRKHFA